jgi:hypothetical protein
VPLICHLIGTEADADSNEFAVTLARWQKSVGLDSDGVLDNDTLARMVSTWQSRRAGSAAFPTADQIVTGAPSEFYDPFCAKTGIENAPHSATSRRSVASELLKRGIALAGASSVKHR